MSATIRSIPEIFGDVIGQFTSLLKKEGELARSEISDKLAHIATGLGFAAVGAVLAIPALVLLLQALVGLLVQTGMAFPLAAVLVGGATLAMGIFMLVGGINRLKSQNLVPEKTIHQLQRDAEMVKQEVS
jgi:Putative Actinobacterial Holin-X, holin superfamily III